jgi:hypothetical protein
LPAISRSWSKGRSSATADKRLRNRNLRSQQHRCTGRRQQNTRASRRYDHTGRRRSSPCPAASEAVLEYALRHARRERIWFQANQLDPIGSICLHIASMLASAERVRHAAGDTSETTIRCSGRRSCRSACGMVAEQRFEDIPAAGSRSGEEGDPRYAGSNACRIRMGGQPCDRRSGREWGGAPGDGACPWTQGPSSHGGLCQWRDGAGDRHGRRP